MRQFTTIFTLLIAAYASPLSSSCKDCATCGTDPAPSNTGHKTPAPIIKGPKVWSFVSEPHLHPMKVKVLTFKRKSTAPGFIFVAPYTVSSNPLYGQPGSLILDNEGIPIWFRPTNDRNLMNIDFRVQTLFGKPVLTFFQGTVVTPPTYTNAPSGSSEPGSCFYILDNSYKTIKTVVAKKGYISDVHEFLITPRNTALLLSTKKVPMDLTPFGGPKNGFVQDFAIQEIDLKTDKLLFFWKALDHIPLTASFEPASSATSNDNIWDAFHLNSVGLTDKEADILVSSRNTWTIYKIHKPNGKIIWELGGKNSSFFIEPGASFSWQHDARFLPNNQISMFDDNCCEGSIPPGTPPARGLILKLDFDKMIARVHRTYFHDPNLQVGTQGNVQSLDNGNKFIGWGEAQYFAEFKNAGNMVTNPEKNTVYNAMMPGDNFSYRAYRNVWVGTPFYPPSLAVKGKAGQVTVYASWNGSTETKTWEVYAGFNPDFLEKVKTAPKKGFETAINVNTNAHFYQIKALDVEGRVIGVSKVVKL